MACEGKDQTGADPLTSRLDNGTFQLIECKNPQGQLTFSLNMVVAGDVITQILVNQGKQLLETYDFVAARDRKTDKGTVTEVELAKEEGRKMAFARWNLKQATLQVDNPNSFETGCKILNKRVWDSLSLPNAN